MPLSSPAHDRLEERSGGGFLILFGTPFFLIGLAVILSALFPSLGWLETDELGFAAYPFGAAFAIAGLLCILGRSGIRVDRKTGEIVQWWGLLRPMKQKRFRLADAVSVHIDREVRRSKNSSYVVHPVRLALRDAAPITFQSPRSSAKARQTAERLCKFLELPLIDLSEGEGLTRQHDELDLNLRQRFEKGSLPASIPDAPPDLRSRIDFDGSRLSVAIPPAGPRLPLLVALGIVLIFCLFGAGIFVAVFFRGPGFEGGFSLFAALFAVVFFSIPISVAFRLVSTMFFETQTISATRDRVELSRGWIWRRVRSVPASEIEEIFVGRNGSNSQALPFPAQQAIVIRSDRRSLRLSSSLPKAELVYLAALLRGVLVA